MSPRVAQVPTLLGPMFAAWTEAGLAALSRRPDLDGFLASLVRRFPGHDFRPDSSDASARRVATELNDYLAGRSRAISAVAAFGGLPQFDVAVYRAVIAIPYGETATYGEVAARVGSPRAARAVGNAMARCPLFPVVPCHRVVRADGIGGWGPDPSLKRALLDLESGRAGTLRRPADSAAHRLSPGGRFR
jgi:methylated-DNA-[protein]-cysteine S-methyltransferase